MKHMELWDKVKVTDPAAVKKITGKPYQGSSPKPYWLIERATEVFGPIGKGWGVTVKSERFERLSDTDVLHVAVVSVWYTVDGERTQTFDQMGGTKACYMTGKGVLMVDEDSGKKSVTDGMVKCLSMIGFAGDIFSGQWDDSKYIDWAEEQYRPKLKEVKKQGGLTGIGDDLPEETKEVLKDYAAQATELVNAGDVVGAIEYLRSQQLETDERLYVDRHLASHIRSAMSKVFNQKKAA